jgi:hypothetical protein
MYSASVWVRYGARRERSDLKVPVEGESIVFGRSCSEDMVARRPKVEGAERRSLNCSMSSLDAVQEGQVRRENVGGVEIST